MERKRVYCSGPLFSATEVAEMEEIAGCLESAGFDTYLPQRDGVEAFIMGSVNSPLAKSRILRPFSRLAEELVFAVDVYQILECDYLVFNMNGRVPDEGAAVEAGMALATGMPLVVYCGDKRSENSRLRDLLGAAPCAHASRIAEIPEQLDKLRKPGGENDRAHTCSKDTEQLAARGRATWRIISRMDFFKPRNRLFEDWVERE